MWLDLVCWVIYKGSNKRKEKFLKTFLSFGISFTQLNRYTGNGMIQLLRNGMILTMQAYE